MPSRPSCCPFWLSHAYLLGKSRRLRHYRPGTVSLSLTENDDETFVKQRPGYRNTEFLITTGPGPAPALDGNNVVQFLACFLELVGGATLTMILMR